LTSFAVLARSVKIVFGAQGPGFFGKSTWEMWSYLYTHEYTHGTYWSHGSTASA